MFIHKFKVGDTDLYAFTGSPSRPSLEKGVTSSSWVGKYNETNANVIQGIKTIKGETFSQEEGAEAPGAPAAAPEEKKPEEKKASKVPLSEMIKETAKKLK